MNNFKGMLQGQGELMDSYPSAAYDALKKRNTSMKLRLSQMPTGKDIKLDSAESLPKANQSLRPRKF